MSATILRFWFVFRSLWVMRIVYLGLVSVPSVPIWHSKRMLFSVGYANHKLGQFLPGVGRPHQSAMPESVRMPVMARDPKSVRDSAV